MLPGLYNSLMQAIMCFMRKIGATESTASFVSGALAGAISLSTKESKDRGIWGLFLLSRAIDCYYRSLINSGVIPKIKLDYAILFACLTVLPSYVFSIEPECTPPSLRKLYTNFTFENEAELTFRRCWVAKKNLSLTSRGLSAHDPSKFL